MTDISGVMVIRNGIKLGYPFIEAVLSILPICDEFIIADGYSEDSTYVWLQRLAKRCPKIKLFRDEWKGYGTGRVVGRQANIAKTRATKKWCFIIQGDEIIHEKCLKEIQLAIENATIIKAFKLKFIHFFTFNYIDGTPAYSQAFRIIRNDRAIVSEGDGWTFQGKIDPWSTIPTSHPVFHFGYVFPWNILYKRINHGRLHSELPTYQAMAKNSQKILDEGGYKGFIPIPDRYQKYEGDIPTIMKGIKEEKQYFVREELIENAR